MARILIVDDEWSNRVALRTVLEHFGHEVIEATGGLEAFGVLRQDRGIELLITDNNMPGGNGLDLLKMLRQEAGFAKLPVILNSGISRDVKSPAQALGATFISKPWGNEEMGKAVAEALAQATA